MLAQEFVLELIRFGAVHWCAVPPEQPSKEGALQLRGLSPAFLARQAALKKFGPNVSILPALPRHSSAQCSQVLANPNTILWRIVIHRGCT